MRNVRVEVVTPVHNRKELTLGCLRSLSKADLTGIDLHVIIVDDGSTDGTAEALAAEFPDVEVIRGSGDLWYTGGMNVAFTAALKHDSDFVLAINNDSEFEPDFLQNMIRTARRVPKSVVGAVLVNWDDRTGIFQVAPKWNVWWGGLRHWVKQTIHTLPKAPWKVELIVGNCVLFPTAAIREVGLMDAKRLPQFGDAEYTPRMRRAGWTLVIEPTARVYCKPNDVPERISEMPVRSFIGKLFDPYHPHSLRRRLNTILGPAPGRFQAYVAMIVFVIRVAIGRNVEGRWAYAQDEPPLAEIYKDATVDQSDGTNSELRPTNAVS